MNKKALLIYDEEGRKVNKDYIEMHREKGQKYGVDIQLVMADEVREYGEFSCIDFAFVRTRDYRLTKFLEKNGVSCYNNSMVSEISNDKFKTYQYIKENTGVPVVESDFYENIQLSESLIEKNNGKVIKSVDGHGGKNVFLIGPDDYSLIKDGIGTSDFIIQPLINAKRDLRVYIIGERIVAGVCREATKGFKSNYSLGGKVSKVPVSGEVEGYIRQIMEHMTFGMVGIDFLLGESGVYLGEIEDVVGARMLYKCAKDIDILDEYFQYVIDK
ncbi:ATP-grasp domain-containing protein [Eubacterium xylanophilum]|uniref:ATP-grasp domain-containing protein n=1 Tax=Eubacterium xylanophilum TaxID=39497 RepID=UPI00047A09A2|nr:ATP-grasp domain-containing protein [Eubacterium xylanophilum]